jgi:K+-sensing histidine kinase KdpD
VATPPTGSLRRLADLGRGRSVAAWLTLVCGLPLLTVALTGVATDVSLESALLLYLLLVIVVALLGGIVPALVAAVSADLLVNYYFVPPVHTLHVASRDQLLAIVVFVVVAVVVSVLVEVSSRRREEAARSRAEADLLTRLSDAPIGEVSTEAVLEEIRRAFAMATVTLVRVDSNGRRTLLAHVGSPGSELASSEQDIPAGSNLRVVVTGPQQFALDLGALRRMALAAARVYEERQLKEQADEAQRLAELDRTRAALLAAVGHDLRTPLAGVKAGVSSLRQSDVSWTAEEREELLATVEESADRLDELVTNLLDATRIQAGAVVVDRQPLGLDEVVLRALLHAPASLVAVDVAESLPLVDADPVLLERVIDNLVSNAVRFTPPGVPVEVVGRADAERVLLDIIDHGPGLPSGAADRIFEPFQRLGDTSQSGTGLGLAIARGFCAAMDATLDPMPTAGGGLTMRISLRAAT